MPDDEPDRRNFEDAARPTRARFGSASRQLPPGESDQLQTILVVLNSTLVSPLAFTVK